MAYSETGLISNLNKEMKEMEKKLLPLDKKDNSCLYATKVMNYAGNVENTKTPYTEATGEYLFNEGFIYDNEIADIKNITRVKSYYTKSHEIFVVDQASNRVEENFVKSLFFYNPLKNKLGTPIDYQTPLKNVSGDNAGKIDLLTFNENTNELFLVEVKDDDSKETALRACLEIQTYYQVVNKEKLIKDFQKAGKFNSANPTIKKAVMFFNGSNPAKEIADLNNRPILKKVIEKFDINVIILDQKVS